MIATCQFCKEIIRGPERPAIVADVSAARAFEYRQLSLLVSAHMTGKHMEEAGSEIITMFTLAGAAIAMRYVDATDPVVHEWRNVMGETLMEQFQPRPAKPLIVMPNNQAAASVPGSGSPSDEEASGS